MASKNPEIAELQRQVTKLTKDLAALTRKQSNDSIFDKDFGGRKVIKRDVQFMGKVRRANGSIVTQVNP